MVHPPVPAQPPPAARLLRDFVNTREPQSATETLATPEDLRQWLAERQLLAADASLRPADLVAARAIREGLRAVLLGHAGHPVGSAELETLNATVAAFPLELRFAENGHHLAASGGLPFRQAVARLLDAVRQCGADQTWSNLKVCARESCRWAFYDASRNHGRRWCSMAGCGNHVKMQRAYAARKDRRAVPPAGR